MKIERVALRRINLPLVSPFRTSLGIEHEKPALLVQVTTQDAEGWGESVAGFDASYSSEYIEGAEDVMLRHLIPLLSAETLTASRVAPLLAPVKGHRMAKAALEMAMMDAELRSHGMSFANALGAVANAVPSGVSVGIMDSVPELLDAVSGYLAQGTSGSSSRSSRAGTSSRCGRCASSSATRCCCRSTRTPPTPLATPATSPTSTTSTCC